MMTTLSTSPAEAAKALLAALPAKRMRDVLERRFGLKGRMASTLEEIGRSYRITRERVRQIEADALRRLRGEEHESLQSLIRAITAELATHGEVMAERHLFLTLAAARLHPHLRFLLRLSPQVCFFPESEEYNARWGLSHEVNQRAEAVLRGVSARLEEAKRPVTGVELRALIFSEAGRAGYNPRIEEEDAVVEAYTAISKAIRQNPYGEYGLISWPTVSPRGIKDKAYAALTKATIPLHFREVAGAIDRVGWTKKKTHPQTVHNELIKDPRFVLVGRGMYALAEWGYEPGTVSEVLVSVLKLSGAPLAKDEIVRLASEKRVVKPQTILLNLQDRSRFKKTEDGRYTLV